MISSRPFTKGVTAISVQILHLSFLLRDIYGMYAPGWSGTLKVSKATRNQRRVQAPLGENIMQLSYRGIRYAPMITVIPTTSNSMAGRYRGVDVDIHQYAIASTCQHRFTMQYRGVTYHCGNNETLSSDLASAY